MPLLKNKERYTYAEYFTWPDDERLEIIGGTPAPGIPHQDVAGTIFFLLKGGLKNHPCRVFISPLDVVLSDVDVVQPDVFVICDPRKIKDTHIKGAPDLIFEILSPSTSLKDRREKKHLYEEQGMIEYILLDPLARTAERFALSPEGTYGIGVLYGEDETLPLATRALDIDLSVVFEPSGQGQAQNS
ncbi:MAG: Uma2 family endonuclease [bacterium]|jgi:Uma2 family endonuclease|nr:Uma2 family endonuclease [bacterium]